MCAQGLLAEKPYCIMEEGINPSTSYAPLLLFKVIIIAKGVEDLPFFWHLPALSRKSIFGKYSVHC